MYKNNEYNIESTCPVCGHSVMIDEIGNGDNCPHCGWVQNIGNIEYPDRVECPNLISLNKAKNYIKKVSLLRQILKILLMDIIFMEKWNSHIKA